MAFTTDADEKPGLQSSFTAAPASLENCSKKREMEAFKGRWAEDCMKHHLRYFMSCQGRSDICLGSVCASRCQDADKCSLKT